MQYFLRILELPLSFKILFADTGARNERRFCALNCNKTPGFEVIQGLLDRFMQILAVKNTESIETNPNQGYHIRAADGNYVNQYLYPHFIPL